MRMRAIAAVLPLVVLAACGTGNVETLRTSNVSGNDFNRRLAADYRGFSTYELDQMYDTADASHFAEKGLMALEGQSVPPEDPATRDINNEEKLAELQAARSRLMTALANEAAQKAPAPTARAQVSYDCWVEQQEEGFQYNDVATCRNGFIRAMQVVETRLQPAAAAPTARDYKVFFDWDSAAITPEANDILRQAADNARRENISVIRIVGHADRSGPLEYNDRLSERRAEAVAQRLRQFGISMNDVAIIGRGEREPLVQTRDGVREVQNRRVQIVLGSRAGVGA